jgi:hypothetical protein
VRLRVLVSLSPAVRATTRLRALLEGHAPWEDILSELDRIDRVIERIARLAPRRTRRA